MFAMVLDAPGRPLRPEQRPTPVPAPGEVLVRVEACAVCRTDLHVVDGDLALPRLPLVPGHEVIGTVESVGAAESRLRAGQRVGIAWLAHTCGHCAYCAAGRENLCDTPVFTGHGRDGGFATHVVAESAYCFPLAQAGDAVRLAPLMCAGLIGWRSLRAAGDDRRAIGLYGFGAAAHLIAQVAVHQGRRVYAFTRKDDAAGQAFARSLGATWAGDSEQLAPVPLDAAIIFAPAGELVPQALRAVRKGGRVVCGGIHMSDIPRFAYRLLWEERELVSVANLTRADATEFLRVAAEVPLDVRTTRYALEHANQALDDVRSGRIEGAAVLVPGTSERASRGLDLQ
jgi:propanol-preferring alcohol dehydrogenase